MPGGFHFGLPELFVDIALLWVPHGHFTRRKGAAMGIWDSRSLAGYGRGGEEN